MARRTKTLALKGGKMRTNGGKPRVYLGDCEEVLRKKVARESVDLIITSPPYAERRGRIYGGVKPDEYVEWFIPKAHQFMRVLKPTASFVLNIKESAIQGERHTYVLELILALKEQGWLWVDEYIWHKKNCYPGKWPNRFRDAWERLLHFTVQRKFKMRQEAVMVPTGDWKEKRLGNLSAKDRTRDVSGVGSGFGKRIENWVGREMAYPTNVLHTATECAHRDHPACFPKDIPEFFIKAFTDEGDTVLDPFGGSGTTMDVAQRLKRRVITCDTQREYYDLMRRKAA